MVLALGAPDRSRLFLRLTYATLNRRPTSADLSLLQLPKKLPSRSVSLESLRENNFKPFEEEKYLSHLQESVAGLNLSCVFSFGSVGVGPGGPTLVRTWGGGQ